MLYFLLNLLVVLTATVGARVIIPQHLLTPTSTSTCTFHTTHPLDPSRIPPSAWPHLTHLLLTAPLRRRLLHSLQTRQNTMQTLDLAAEANDDSFSGIKLGIVFTARRKGCAPEAREDALPKQKQKQKQSGGEVDGFAARERPGRGMDELECLDVAVREAGERRMMEGVMEFEGGRVAFLVYRVD